MSSRQIITLRLMALVLVGVFALSTTVTASAQQIPKRKPVSIGAPASSPQSTSQQPAGQKNNAPTNAQLQAARQYGSNSVLVSPGTKTLAIEVPINSSVAIDFTEIPRHIRITSESIADIQQVTGTNRFVIQGNEIGSTNVLFLNEQGDVIRQADINVVINYASIKAALKKLMPSETINVSAHRGNIFLSGKVTSGAASQQAHLIASRYVDEPGAITNMLTITGSQQVIIQVRVAEMARTIKKGLSGNITAGFNNLSLGTSNSFVDSATFPTLVSGSISTTFNALSSTIGPSTFQALESDGLIKTLAEPTLTALSGESASFLSGGEYPFPSAIASDGSITYEYQEFGIGLDLTPTVLSGGLINLKIATEISAIGAAVTVVGGTLNQITRKRTNTNVNLASGTTLMISGLLQDDINNVVQGTPFLKDIPVLGALFRSTEFLKEQTELVILVTAYLAAPSGSERKLLLPTDGFQPGSDIDIYLLGRLHRYYGRGEEPFWDDPFTGPFGYLMR